MRADLTSGSEEIDPLLDAGVGYALAHTAAEASSVELKWMEQLKSFDENKFH